MDLGTIKTKLNGSQYKIVEEFLNDIQLTWDNCKRYNSEGSWIYKLADKLDKLSRKSYKNYLPQVVFIKDKPKRLVKLPGKLIISA